MKKLFRKGILIPISFALLVVSAIVLKTEAVKADESGASDGTTIVKLKDFAAGSMLDNGETDLVIGANGSFTVVEPNGTMHTIEDAEITLLGEESYSSAAYKDYLFAYNSENKTKLLNIDGSKFSTSTWAKASGMLSGTVSSEWYYLDDSNVFRIMSQSGQELLKTTLPGTTTFAYAAVLDYDRGGYQVSYFIDREFYVLVFDKNGTNITPKNETKELRSLVGKKNYYMAGWDGGSITYYDKDWKPATNEQYAADAEAEPRHYNPKADGMTNNSKSDIAKAVPEGFNYKGEKKVNGVSYGVGCQMKNGKYYYVLYNSKSEILITSVSRMIQFAGPYFCIIDSDTAISLYRLENTSGEGEEVAKEFSEGAKVVDENGNPISLDNVVIKAVEAIQETVAKAKEALANKGVTIPAEAHVHIFDVDMRDGSGNVLRLVDGSVIFYLPPEKDVDMDKYTARVYHVLSDGSCEEVKCEWDKDKGLAVTTTGLSPFVVVYEPNVTKSPKTGETSNIALYLAILATGTLALGVIAKKKEY